MNAQLEPNSTRMSTVGGTLQALGFVQDGQLWTISTPTSRISVRQVDRPPSYTGRFFDHANQIEDIIFFDVDGDKVQNLQRQRELVSWAVHCLSKEGERVSASRSRN
jgi:hypothetical protein